VLVGIRERKRATAECGGLLGDVSAVTAGEERDPGCQAVLVAARALSDHQQREEPLAVEQDRAVPDRRRR
jgi:hypothetical protein